ncbi:MAG: hypothetical protein P8P72_07930 [Flavobacteriaceae bacterium]|nr:hypothetical protein [Flavobacteriaceae bacterium]
MQSVKFELIFNKTALNSISKSKLCFLKGVLLLFFLLNFIETNAQEGEFIKIENFIYKTDLLKRNEKGIIIQQLDRSLNDRIEFFIEETFSGIVESTKNIIWQSYQTTTNTIYKSHHITFTVRVSLFNKNQNKEFRYLEIGYLPSTDKLFTNYIWDKQKRKFRLDDNEMERRSYLSNLSDLKIENQETKPRIDDLLKEYRSLLAGVNDNFIYFNKSKEDELDIINDGVSNYILQQFPNVDFIMNIVFDSYHTFVSAYDVYHYYTFIIQVKLKGSSFPNFIETFFNPTTGNINSDFLWSNDREIFYRPNQNE